MTTLADRTERRFAEAAATTFLDLAISGAELVIRGEADPATYSLVLGGARWSFSSLFESLNADPAGDLFDLARHRDLVALVHAAIACADSGGYTWSREDAMVCAVVETPGAEWSHGLGPSGHLEWDWWPRFELDLDDDRVSLYERYPGGGRLTFATASHPAAVTRIKKALAGETAA